LKKTKVNVPIQLVIDMQNDRTYYKRISDKVLDLKLRAFGATNIVGPKWCGKTETALQKAKSKIMLQKDPNKEGLIYTAKINPSVLLDGEKDYFQQV
jgi:hypothetical protein